MCPFFPLFFTFFFLFILCYVKCSEWQSLTRYIKKMLERVKFLKGFLFWEMTINEMLNIFSGSKCFILFLNS